MAMPTPPTVNSLCREAFRRCGIASPTTAQLTRAEDEWFEDVKREIASRKTWHSIEETIAVIPQAYLQVYALPTTILRIMRMRFYRGATTGVAQGGGASTITVAAGTGQASWAGRKIFLTDGVGAAQAGRIVAVNGDVVTISCSWVTQPSAGTSYVIADNETPIDGPTRNLRLDGRSPSSHVLAWDFIEHTFRISPPLDNARQYGIEIDGEIDISLIDKTDPRITHLLREWRSAIVYGVMVKIKEDQDDASVDRDERKFEKALMQAMKQDGRKRLRGEAVAMQSIGGMPRRRR